MEKTPRVLASEVADCLQKAQDDFFSLASLGKLYQSALELTERWCIVLDGVDECESEQQRLMYDFFSRLLDNSGPQRLRILFSGRENTKQHIEGYFGSVERIVTGLSGTSADISAFAEDVILEKQFRDELVVRDPDLIDDILKTIASKEEGM